MTDCDNGWKHLCGGPHEVEPDDDRETVPVRTITTTVLVPAEGDFPEHTVDLTTTLCATVRCDVHCSCFGGDEHHPDCSGGELA